MPVTSDLGKFAGNLNITYDYDASKFLYVTFGEDEVKTQIQDLLWCIKPELMMDVMRAVVGNIEYVTSAEWKCGDDEEIDE